MTTSGDRHLAMASGNEKIRELIRRQTNAIDLLDDGIENGSDLKNFPADTSPHRQATSSSQNDLTRKSAPEKTLYPPSSVARLKGRLQAYKVVAAILCSFSLLLLTTIILNFPSETSIVSGVVQDCSPSLGFGQNRGTGWYQCTVTLRDSNKKVFALSRGVHLRGEAVMVTVSSHSLTGVKYFDVLVQTH